MGRRDGGRGAVGSALSVGLVAAIGCASYAGGRFGGAAHPELEAVMLASGQANPIGVPVAELRIKRRGGRTCTDLAHDALRDLLARATARGAVGVKEVQFHGRSKWVGKVVCRESLFGRSVEARGVAYSLGAMVPIPSSLVIEVPKGMRPQLTEVAILGAAVDEPIPAWVTTYIKPASLPLEALKMQWLGKPQGSGWSADSRESGRIVAAYRQDRFALRVLVTYSREAVAARIADSKNLGQTSTHISAEAATRFRDFVATIQASLADLAARGQQ